MRPLENIFVGREKELIQFRSLLNEIELSGGIGIAIVGPRGVGKSALVEKFISMIPTGFRWSVAYGRARSNLRAQWTAYFFKNIGMGRRAFMKSIPDTLAVKLLELEKDGFRDIDMETFAKMVEFVAHKVPMVLFAEDVDSPSRGDEVIRIWRRIWGLPVMIVLTACSFPSCPSEWNCLNLNPLTHAELNELVTNLVGTEQTPDFIDWLWRKSGGFPHRAIKILNFLTECRTMDENGIFVGYDSLKLDKFHSECRNQFEKLGQIEQDFMKFLACIGSMSVSMVNKLFPDLNTAHLQMEGLVRFNEDEIAVSNGLMEDFIVSEVERSGSCDELIRRYIQHSSDDLKVYLLLKIGTLTDEEREFLKEQLKSDWLRRDSRLHAALMEKLCYGNEKMKTYKPLYGLAEALPDKFEATKEELDRILKGIKELENEQYKGLKEKLIGAAVLCKKGKLDEAIESLLEIYNSVPVGSEVWLFSAIEIGRLSYATGDIEMSDRFLLKALRSLKRSEHKLLKARAISLEIAIYGTKGLVSKMSSLLWSTISQTVHERDEFMMLMQQYSTMLFMLGFYHLNINLMERMKFASFEDEKLREFQIAETLLEMGEAELAIPRFREGWHFLKHIPLWRPVGERLKALIDISFGDMDSALHNIDLAIKHYSEMKAVIGLIKSYAIRGEILLSKGEQQGLLEIDRAVKMASSKAYNLLLPYVFERGIRGLSRGGAELDDSNLRDLVKRYVETVRSLGSDVRISLFLNTLSDKRLREFIESSFYSEPKQSRIKLKLLGPFKIILPSLDILMHLGSVKAKQVLATIAISPIARINTSAHALANMLWPDMSPSRQIHNIHWILTHIRKTLGQNIFRKEGDQYRLDGDFVWVDLLEFKRLMDEGTQSEHFGRMAAAVSKYEEAIRLVEGEPMADVVYEAIEPFVQHIKRLTVECYTKVAKYYLDAFDPQKAIRYASMGMVIEPLSESLKSILIDAYIALGDKEMAQREKELFDQRLEN